MRIFASLMPLKDGDISHWVGILESCVDGFHIDIMDGQFVPSEHGSLELVSRVRSLTRLPIWIHLMVSHPQGWIDRLNLRQSDIVSVHYEACGDGLEIMNALGVIREKGGSVSLALNPDTALETILPYISHVDQVLLMGVVPGRSGQAMLGGTRDRIRALHKLREDSRATFRIALDGGVTPQSLAELSPYLPDDCAAASFIVHSSNPCEAVDELRGISINLF